MKYEDCSCRLVPEGAEVIVFEHGRGAKVDESPYSSPKVFRAHSHDIDGSPCKKGIHTVRHPYEVIVSACEWHKIVARPWVDNKRENGRTYREHVLGSDGLLYEMGHRSRQTIMEMYHWSYDDERFLNVKLEDFWDDFEGTTKRVADWLELDQEVVMSCTDNLDIRKNVPDYATNRTGQKWRWQNVFTDEHFAAFAEMFPNDTLEKLGYGDEQ
jgi:hypothetical protein